MRLMVKYLILPSAPTIAAGSGWGRCRWLNAYKITFSGTKEMHDGFFDLFLPVLLKNMICKFWSHCDKIVLKKPRWVVLLFKNFHSVLCFNHGFYQQLGALFWGLATLQWFVCRVPWAGGLSLSSPLGQVGGYWGFLREFYCWPWWAAAASEEPAESGAGSIATRPARGAWELEMAVQTLLADTARMSIRKWMGKSCIRIWWKSFSVWWRSL